MATHGSSFDVLVEDDLYRDSLGMKLLQIGEMAQRLSDGFRNANSHIPWKTIKGTRVLMTHNYLGLEFETMWETVTVDIPELKKFCAEVLFLVKIQGCNPSDDDPGSGGPRMR